MTSRRSGSASARPCRLRPLDDDVIRVETPQGREHAELLVAADGDPFRAPHRLFRPAPRQVPRCHRVADPDRGRERSEHIRLDATTLWMGPGYHVVHYPLRQATVLNVVVILPEKAVAPTPALARAARLRALLEAAPQWQSVAARRHCARRMAGTARNPGRRCGACDGAELGAGRRPGDRGCDRARRYPLRAAPPTSPAPLDEFERLRRARAERVARESARNLRVYGLSGITATLRDVAISALPMEAHLRRLDWLFAPIRDA